MPLAAPGITEGGGVGVSGLLPGNQRAVGLNSPLLTRLEGKCKILSHVGWCIDGPPRAKRNHPCPPPHLGLAPSPTPTRRPAQRRASTGLPAPHDYPRTCAESACQDPGLPVFNRPRNALRLVPGKLGQSGGRGLPWEAGPSAPPPPLGGAPRPSAPLRDRGPRVQAWGWAHTHTNTMLIAEHP